MKFVWNAPEPVAESCQDGRPHACSFPRTFWEKPIIGWLQYQGVFLGDFRTDWTLEFNYVYFFFDLHVYEYQKGGNPRAAMENLEKYLVSTSLDWQVSDTFRWESGKQIPGRRYWIQAEDHPRRRT